MKRCNKCGVEKPPQMFHRDRAKSDGLCNSCKACNSAAYRVRKGPPRRTFAELNQAERMEWFRDRSYVDPTTGCWIWMLGEYGGYGVTMDHSGGTRKIRKTTRVVFELFVGGRMLNEGEHVCHRCDTPMCINPQHLFLGTHSQNHRDCVRKERSGQAKLTNRQAVEIRYLRANGMTIGRLARRYRVVRTTIQSVIMRESFVDAETVAR